MPVHNAEIAAMFDQAAGSCLRYKGDNPFRTRAYRRAARVLESLPKSVAAMLRAGEDLAELPGIGEDSASKIATIVETGKFDLLELLERELPGDFGEIAAIPGLGPKRVKLLIDTIEDVRRAAKQGRLGELPGFGPKLQQNILAELAKPVAAKRFKLPFAEAEAGALIGSVAAWTAAASWRRGAFGAVARPWAISILRDDSPCGGGRRQARRI